MRKGGKQLGICRKNIKKIAINFGVLSIFLIVLSAQIVAGAQTVCYGDSITYSEHSGIVGIYPDMLNESLSNYYGVSQEVINEGHPGWTSFDGASYVTTIIANYPNMDQVCLMFGTNDAHVNHQTSRSVFKSNMGYMIDAFQNEGVEVILGILPPVCEEREYQHDRVLILNEVLSELALEKGVYIADTPFYFDDTWSSIYFQDCLHPNEVGYKIMGNTSFFLPIVDSHRLHNGYNLLSTNTIVESDNVNEINVTATTWDKERVNITVYTYSSKRFTLFVDGTTNITINMTNGTFEIVPFTEYDVYRDSFFYQNVNSTLDGHLTFSVDLSNPPHIIDVYVRTYLPPTPTNLLNTTSNYWVNYTWVAGTGNVTDLYNVSMNGTWYNGTSDTFRNVYVGPSGWANISVWAYNSSGSGTLSASCVSDGVQAPSPTPTPTPTPTPIIKGSGGGGGGGASLDSDGDGYFDTVEIMIGTDPNDPNDYPNKEAATSTPTSVQSTITKLPPTVTSSVPSPLATPTPEPATPTTPEEPGFEAIFAVAGLLTIAYVVLRRRG